MFNREKIFVFTLSKAPYINGLNNFNSENYKNSDTSKFVGFKNSFICKLDIVIIRDRSWVRKTAHDNYFGIVKILELCSFCTRNDP